MGRSREGIGSQQSGKEEEEETSKFPQSKTPTKSFVKPNNKQKIDTFSPHLNTFSLFFFSSSPNTKHQTSSSETRRLPAALSHTPTSPPPTARSMASKTVTLEELSQHKTSTSVWMAIDSKVYDVTSFLDDHPGGEEVLRDKAGDDATEAYNDVGHSDQAHEMLKKYLVGTLSVCLSLSSSSLPLFLSLFLSFHFS